VDAIRELLCRRQQIEIVGTYLRSFEFYLEGAESSFERGGAEMAPSLLRKEFESSLIPEKGTARCRSFPGYFR
jgi:hypothetical protein